MVIFFEGKTENFPASRRGMTPLSGNHRALRPGTAASAVAPETAWGMNGLNDPMK
jgi:hypothetical protein